MRLVAEVTRGAVGETHWRAQQMFLLSADGIEYINRLDRFRLGHFELLKRSSEARRARA